ncbi:MAG: hypothetical protein GXO88_14760 [Chlorobi bacterium]|nr:hypothetical protein [Chlorobiota bacterium]
MNPDGVSGYASDIVMAKNGFEIYTGNIHASTIQSGFDINKISADPVNRKLYLYNTLSLHNNEIFITSLDDPLNNTIKPEDNERGIFEKRALRAMAF